MQKRSTQGFLSFARNLIQSFENNKISEKDINRNLGIFYTPKPIVEYMVSNIFRIYFEELFKSQNLFQQGFSWDSFKDYITRNQNLNKKFRERIKKIKILDPACGSGRFLVAAANKLYNIYKTLNPKKNNFDLKKEIIENHLYGVEIEKSAYIISKLNLLLWLFSEDLSNFSFNEIDINKSNFENLDIIINRFNINLNIYNLDFLFDFTIQHFSVIMSNPPYLENKKLTDKKYKKKLTERFNTAYRLFDISILFIEKSLELLKQNEGCLCFLTTNKFLSADYGIKIRDLIINNTTLKEIINISSLPIFKKVSTYPIIISFLNKKPSKDNSVSIQKFNSIQDMNKNNLSYLRKISQFSIKKIPANIIPISGKINLLNYLYENFKPMKNAFNDLKIVYRPFGFLDYSKYFDNISETKETDNDILLIGTGNVGKYHIKFNKHIRISKRDLKISYFKFIPHFEKIWKTLTSEKLIFREIAKDLTWVYDPGVFTNITGLYLLSIPSFSTNKLFALLSIMNSDMMNLSFKSMFSSLHMSGDYLRFNGSFIKRLPLPREFPLSLSYLGKINQILSQLQYDLHSIDIKSFKNAELSQFKKRYYSEVKILLEFYKKLTNSLVTLLYFKELFAESGIRFNLINELLYKKDLIPNIQFKYILPRFSLLKFRTYQKEELKIIISKLNRFYKELNENYDLLSQLEKISYNNLSSGG